MKKGSGANAVEYVLLVVMAAFIVFVIFTVVSAEVNNSDIADISENALIIAP